MSRCPTSMSTWWTRHPWLLRTCSLLVNQVLFPQFYQKTSHQEFHRNIIIHNEHIGAGMVDSRIHFVYHETLQTFWLTISYQIPTNAIYCWFPGFDDGSGAGTANNRGSDMAVFLLVNVCDMNLASMNLLLLVLAYRDWRKNLNSLFDRWSIAGSTIPRNQWTPFKRQAV